MAREPGDAAVGDHNESTLPRGARARAAALAASPLSNSSRDAGVWPGASRRRRRDGPSQSAFPNAGTGAAPGKDSACEPGPALRDGDSGKQLRARTALPRHRSQALSMSRSRARSLLQWAEPGLAEPADEEMGASAPRGPRALPDGLRGMDTALRSALLVGEDAAGTTAAAPVEVDPWARSGGWARAKGVAARGAGHPKGPGWAPAAAPAGACSATAARRRPARGRARSAGPSRPSAATPPLRGSRAAPSQPPPPPHTPARAPGRSGGALYASAHQSWSGIQGAGAGTPGPGPRARPRSAPRWTASASRALGRHVAASEGADCALMEGGDAWARSLRSPRRQLSLTVAPPPPSTPPPAARGAGAGMSQARDPGLTREALRARVRATPLEEFLRQAPPAPPESPGATAPQWASPEARERRHARLQEAFQRTQGRRGAQQGVRHGGEARRSPQRLRPSSPTLRRRMSTPRASLWGGALAPPTPVRTPTSEAGGAAGEGGQGPGPGLAPAPAARPNEAQGAGGDETASAVVESDAKEAAVPGPDREPAAAARPRHHPSHLLQGASWEDVAMGSVQRRVSGGAWEHAERAKQDASAQTATPAPSEALWRLAQSAAWSALERMRAEEESRLESWAAIRARHAPRLQRPALAHSARSGPFVMTPTSAEAVQRGLAAAAVRE